MKKTVLLSLHDKSGLEAFAGALAERGYSLLSSSGTAACIRKAGISVTEVSELTEFPHIMEGRVKTLHPRIFGGILARRGHPVDEDDAKRYAIPMIDMVVCNLYPFEETAKRDSSLEELLDNIDIGGVALIRAAAKNYRNVVVLTDPADYGTVVEEIDAEGDVTLPTRQKLALKAFRLTSGYDATIHEGLSNTLGAEKDDLPDETVLRLKKAMPLRYGENPHQAAALYEPVLAPIPFEVLGGKEISYNNILDIDTAMRGLSLLGSSCAALVIKHTTPCGMAIGTTPLDAYEKAYACDPLSAYGGIVGVTRNVDAALAHAIISHFTEVVVAPSFSEDALEIIREERPALRMVLWKGGRISPVQMTGTWGGVLLQEDRLPPLPDPAKGQWIGKERNDRWDDLILAWKVAALSKSNAVALVRDGMAVGIGMGFCSRIYAVRFAIEQAGEKAKDAVMASDAFFPFPDGIEAAAAAGIPAVMQPGGSVHDADVIEAAKKLSVSMFLSAHRTFRH